MRKLIVCNITSLDGFFEGPGNDVMTLPFAEAFNTYNAERLRAADTLLLGRTTYEGFAAHWPSIADDESQDPLQREISRLNGAIDKLVVSDTLVPEPGAPWTDRTRVVPRAGARAVIAELKAGDGGDVLVFGSHTTWNALVDVVDELHLLVGAALLGGGTPVFGGERTPLELLEARPLDGGPLVLVRYAVAAG